MNEINNVILIGRGMIGSVFGVAIHKGFPESLKILADGARAERYRREALIFNRERIEFTYVTPDNKTGEFADLILIATKQTALPEALELISGYVGPDTQILPMQNGLASECVAAKRYGEGRVLHAFVYGNGLLTEEGYLCPRPGKIFFGELDNTHPSERVLRIGRYFEKAGVHYEIPADMREKQWKKFIMNVGVNQASGVLRARFGDYVRSDRARALLEGLMEEAAAIARAAGVRGVDGMVRENVELLLRSDPEGCPSMLMDIEAKQVTEVEIFSGEIRRLGKEYGIPTPLNDLAYRVLTIVDDMHRNQP